MIPIKLYNTLTRTTERFEPLDPPAVTMYNCGPTVYDYAHIGNFRAFVFADVLRRFLELAGFRVEQVMNITDVGHMTEDELADGAGADKMQVAVDRARQARESGDLSADAIADPTDPYQVAAYYSRAFLDDARAVGLKVAAEGGGRMPRATDYIGAMQETIERLLERGHAYVAEDGAVYYAVESFPGYGGLSGNTLDRLQGGAGGRVREADQARKRHPADFLLWKPDPSHLMKWSSPWGEGYPGWHIECSVMAMRCLGREEIDIHTGGEDNIFPHHECEIAQSCGATGRDRFARYWLHARFLMAEGEKMSKRLGNFYTVRGLREEGIDPAVIRYELLKTHYRANMNFTRKGLADAAHAVRRLRDAAAAAERESGGAAEDPGAGHPAVAGFMSALADDVNTSGALGALFAWLHDNDDPPARRLGVLRRLDTVLNVLDPALAPSGPISASRVAEKCRAIDEARARKDYDTADALREELRAAGYEIQITPDGAQARVPLA